MHPETCPGEVRFIPEIEGCFTLITAVNVIRLTNTSQKQSHVYNTHIIISLAAQCNIHCHSSTLPGSKRKLNDKLITELQAVRRDPMAKLRHKSEAVLHSPARTSTL